MSEEGRMIDDEALLARQCQMRDTVRRKNPKKTPNIPTDSYSTFGGNRGAPLFSLSLSFSPKWLVLSFSHLRWPLQSLSGWRA